MTYEELARAAGCSPRQVEVLVCIDKGMSLRDIGRALNIEKSTVQHHRDAGYLKIMRYLERKIDASDGP